MLSPLSEQYRLYRDSHPNLPGRKIQWRGIQFSHFAQFVFEAEAAGHNVIHPEVWRATLDSVLVCTSLPRQPTFSKASGSARLDAPSWEIQRSPSQLSSMVRVCDRVRVGVSSPLPSDHSGRVGVQGGRQQVRAIGRQGV
jgi:hypothetical protein